MPKLTFPSDGIGRALTLAKLVKPAISKFSMSVTGDQLTIFSYDKRRWSRACVRADSVQDVSPDYESGEFFVAADRQALVHTDLEKVTLSMGEKAVTLKADGSGQSRTATLQRRSQDSKLAKIARAPSMDGATRLRADEFGALIHQASCSALVKETKTDEARRVNQVHFYPEESCAYSNARSFLTITTLPGHGLDLSISSDDLPLIAAFCGRFGELGILVRQDAEHLFVADESATAALCLSRVASKKPPLPAIDSNEFSVEVRTDRAQFVKAMQWANMTIEGTQRASFRTSAETGLMEIFHGKQEVSTLPVKFTRGSSLVGDFPHRVLATVSHSLTGSELILKYGHSKHKAILEVSEESSSRVKSRHLLQEMVTR